MTGTTDGNDAMVTAPAPALCVSWQDAGVWQRSGFAAFLVDHGIQRSDLVASDLSTTNGEELRFFRCVRMALKHTGRRSLTLNVCLWDTTV